MEENNFNAGNNYVHSEPTPVKSGSGLSKVLAICFAITTIASMATLAYVYTSKNKDNKKLNEELVESKEKVKSANESIAKYEEATQTKITDVKQDNVTVKEIVKPMPMFAELRLLRDTVKSDSGGERPVDPNDEYLKKYKTVWTTAHVGEVFTTKDAKYIIAVGSKYSEGSYYDQNNHYEMTEAIPYSGGPAVFYRALPLGNWVVLYEGNGVLQCDDLDEHKREAIRGITDYAISQIKILQTKCIDKNGNLHDV